MPNNERVPPNHRHIAIIGVGGVGTWSAIAIALAAKGQPGLVDGLMLFDHDRLEQRNFARVPLATYGEQTPKANAVRAFIQDMCRWTSVVAYRTKLTEANIDPSLRGVDTVICATDDVNNQRLVQLWCTRNSKLYQRAGYDGDTINICRQLPLTFDEAEEAADAGYHGQPEVYHAMLAGTLAAYSVLRIPITVMGEVAKLAVSDCSGVPDQIRHAIASQEGIAFACGRGYHQTGDCSHEGYIRVAMPPTQFVSQMPFDHRSAAADQFLKDYPEEVMERAQTLHQRGHRSNRGWCPWCRERVAQQAAELTARCRADAARRGQAAPTPPADTA